jgi:hypothetical protein
VAVRVVLVQERLGNVDRSRRRRQYLLAGIDGRGLGLHPSRAVVGVVVIVKLVRCALAVRAQRKLVACVGFVGSGRR